MKDRNVDMEILEKGFMKGTRINKIKGIIIKCVSFILAVMLLCAMGWLYGRKQGKEKAEAEILDLRNQIAEQQKQIDELINTPIVVNPVAPEINLDIIYSEIKNIAELATIEYFFTDAAEFSDSQQIFNWNIPFTEKSFILKWDGMIKAGVNLEQVKIEVREYEGKITVTVPAAEILSYEIDTESVEVLNEADNIFNPIKVSDKIQFDQKTEDAMKKRAIENGLLEKAQKNAEDILRRLITADEAISDQYSIEIVTND